MCTVDVGSGMTVDVCRWLAQSPHYLLRRMSEHVVRAAGEKGMREDPLTVLEINAGSGHSCEVVVVSSRQ